MNINSVFKNDVQLLRDAIDNIQVIGCIKSFSNYITTGGLDQNSLEYKYIELLSKDLDPFVLEIFMRKYHTKSKAELLKDIKTMMYEGYHNIGDNLADNSFQDVMYGYSDSDLHLDIISYMGYSLGKLLNSLELSNKEITSKKLNEEINKYKKIIDDNNTNLQNSINKLEKLMKE